MNGRPPPKRVSGKLLAAKHGVDASHCLYRQTGDWYHLPTTFPAALFDADGYLRFPTRESYEDYIRNGSGGGVKQFINKNTLTIRDGIRSHPDYVLFHRPRSLDKIADSVGVLEGAVQQVHVNRYERDPSARRSCIEEWGGNCSVCGLNFENFYGEIGAGFIHVHHLVPLAKIKTQHVLDPRRDLRPVCPNCHAMLHRRDPPLTIEELQSFVALRTTMK